LQGEKSGVSGAFRKLLVLFLLPLVLSGCAGKEMSAFDGEDAPPKAAATESGAEKTTGGEDNLGAEKLAGTNRRPALSNNDAARGNQPRPADFEGIWFEEEPEDRREHVVWKSQEFVGRPIDLPRISAEKGHGPFVGLPDICSPVVKKRMAELGYESDERFDESNQIEYGCVYTNLRAKTVDQVDTIIASFTMLDNSLQAREPESRFPLPAGTQFMEASFNQVEWSCFLRGNEHKRSIYSFINTGISATDRTTRSRCDANVLHWQVLNNVSGGEIK